MGLYPLIVKRRINGSRNRAPHLSFSAVAERLREGSFVRVSASRFHVPQGRSKIAQRFIAELWREHKTSPVRDERTHRSSPIFSVAPPGLWPFSNRNPRLKPCYFRSSLSGLWDPCSSVVQPVCDAQHFRRQCFGGN